MKIRKTETILILLIILFTGFIRFYRFGQIPESLYWDEVAIGLDTRSIIQTGRDLSNNHWFQPIFYSYGDYKAPVYIWLTTLFSLPFGVTEIAVRLPSVLASLAIALVLYKLSALVSSKKSMLPIFVLLSFLIMPWSFHFSHIGMESYLSLFWLTLMVYLQILALKTKRPLLLILAAISGVFSIYSYIAARVICLILFISTFIIFHNKRLKKSLPSFLISLVILVASIGFLIKSPYYSASQNYRLSNNNLLKTTEYIQQSILAQETDNHSLLSRVFHHRYIYWLQLYFQNYFTHFSPDFLMFDGDNNLRHHSGFGGQLLFIQGFLLIIGFFSLLSSNKKIAAFILIWVVTGPAISALVNEVPHASRAIYLIVPLAWLIGLGIDSLYLKLKKLKSGNLIFIGFLIVLSLNFAIFLHDYFIHYPSHSHLAWLVPYKKSALYFKDNYPEKKVFITNEWYQPGLYFHFYQNTPINLLQGQFEQSLKRLDPFIFQLPTDIQPGSLYIAPPDWQADKTEVISEIPGTQEVVIKKTP